MNMPEDTSDRDIQDLYDMLPSIEPPAYDPYGGETDDEWDAAYDRNVKRLRELQEEGRRTRQKLERAREMAPYRSAANYLTNPILASGAGIAYDLGRHMRTRTAANILPKGAISPKQLFRSFGTRPDILSMPRKAFKGAGRAALASLLFQLPGIAYKFYDPAYEGEGLHAALGAAPSMMFAGMGSMAPNLMYGSWFHELPMKDRARAYKINTRAYAKLQRHRAALAKNPKLGRRVLGFFKKILPRMLRRGR